MPPGSQRLPKGMTCAVCAEGIASRASPPSLLCLEAGRAMFSPRSDGHHHNTLWRTSWLSISAETTRYGLRWLSRAVSFSSVLLLFLLYSKCWNVSRV